MEIEILSFVPKNFLFPLFPKMHLLFLTIVQCAFSKITYRWSHTILYPVCLISFVHLNYFKIIYVVCINSLFLFSCRIVFYYSDIPLSIGSAVNGHLSFGIL